MEAEEALDFHNSEQSLLVQHGPRSTSLNLLVMARADQNIRCHWLWHKCLLNEKYKSECQECETRQELFQEVKTLLVQASYPSAI